MTDIELSQTAETARDAVLREHPNAVCKRSSPFMYKIVDPASAQNFVERVYATGVTASEAWHNAYNAHVAVKEANAVKAAAYKATRTPEYAESKTRLDEAATKHVTFSEPFKVTPDTSTFTPVPDNKELHALYVWWAMEHLEVLRKCLKKLYRSNLNWHGPRMALNKERATLIRENDAYKEAAWRLLMGEAVLYGDDGQACGTFSPVDETTDEARERIAAENAEALRVRNEAEKAKNAAKNKPANA